MASINPQLHSEIDQTSRWSISIFARGRIVLIVAPYSPRHSGLFFCPLGVVVHKSGQHISKDSLGLVYPTSSEYQCIHNKSMSNIVVFSGGIIMSVVLFVNTI
ncbi:hypothetical protein J3459_011092 [Metarhizium acridum]|nr:hypothetical protein J3459_011092 [Metarhizium acridum]